MIFAVSENWYNHIVLTRSCKLVSFLRIGPYKVKMTYSLRKRTRKYFLKQFLLVHQNSATACLVWHAGDCLCLMSLLECLYSRFQQLSDCRKLLHNGLCDEFVWSSWPSTSNCQIKFDYLEKRRSYKVFNMTAYQFFSIQKCSG